MNKILLAVDASPHSEKATTVAATLARALAAEVVVLHVIGRRTQAHSPGAYIRDAKEQVADTDAVAARLSEQGIRARPETRPALEGVAEEIVQVARQEHADLIVMGSRGLSDLSGLILGSVTHKALHLAEIPVLVVR